VYKHYKGQYQSIVTWRLDIALCCSQETSSLPLRETHVGLNKRNIGKFCRIGGMRRTEHYA
jgi:hypothetical protein